MTAIKRLKNSQALEMTAREIMAHYDLDPSKVVRCMIDFTEDGLVRIMAERIPTKVISEE